MAKTPQVDIMRSPLGRARGLGAAKAGAVHWWMQRLTSLALVIATFHHLQAGMQVVIEDYVTRDWLRIGSILLVKALCILLALACIVSVLRLGL